MERIAACVNGGIVENLIIMNDETKTHLSGQYEFIDEVTDADPRPRIGWTYSAADGYRAPKPFSSWVYNNGSWVPPVPLPDTENHWEWSEERQQWDQIDLEDEWDTF